MVSNLVPGTKDCHMMTFDGACDIAKSVNSRYSREHDDVWINLTNGIEVVPYLNESVSYGFCRLRSCSFEQANWNDAIADMPDDMLIRLALGRTEYVIDLGANRPCPRALRQGLMIAIRRISVSWDIPVSEHMYLCDRSGRPMRVSDDFARQSMRLDKRQRGRLEYFRKYLDTDCLHIVMMCAPTGHDGDYELHSRIAKRGM